LAFQNRRKYSFFGLFGWIALCLIASATGAFIHPDDWYANLNKPSWNPPNSIFGPVWVTLYFTMAISAWMIWQRGGWAHQRMQLVFFLAQLVLNALWTPLFFGLHKPAWALFNIILLWLSVAATIVLFFRVSKTAAWLLTPYLVWVSFAAFLNYTLWRMNP